MMMMMMMMAMMMMAMMMMIYDDSNTVYRVSFAVKKIVPTAREAAESVGVEPEYVLGCRVAWSTVGGMGLRSLAAVSLRNRPSPRMEHASALYGKQNGEGAGGGDVEDVKG